MRLSQLVETLQSSDVPVAWFTPGSGGWSRLPQDVRFDQMREYFAVFEDEGQQYLVSFSPRDHRGVNIVFVSFHPTKDEGSIPPNVSRTGMGRPFSVLNAVVSVVRQYVLGADPEAIGYKPNDAALGRVFNLITRRVVQGYVRVDLAPPDVVFVREDLDPGQVSADYPTGGIAH